MLRNIASEEPHLGHAGHQVIRVLQGVFRRIHEVLQTVCDRTEIGDDIVHANNRRVHGTEKIGNLSRQSLEFAEQVAHADCNFVAPVEE